MLLNLPSSKSTKAEVICAKVLQMPSWLDYPLPNICFVVIFTAYHALSPICLITGF